MNTVGLLDVEGNHDGHFFFNNFVTFYRQHHSLILLNNKYLLAALYVAMLEVWHYVTVYNPNN